MFAFNSNWTVNANTFNVVLQAAEHLQLKRHELINTVGVTAEDLASPSNRVSVSKYYQLFELIEAKTGNGNIGLLVGKIAHANMQNLQTYMTTICSTLRDYLQLAPSFPHFSGDTGEAKVTSEANYLRIEWHPLLSKTNLTRYFTDSFLVMAAQIIAECCIYPIKITRAQLSYPRPADTQLLVDYFGDNLQFDCPISCIYIERKALDYPMCQYEYHLSDRFIGQLKQLFDGQVEDEFLNKVRQSIIKSLPKGQVSIVDVAEQLNISKRTLQRRLTDRDCHFGQILQEIRTLLSKRFMADDKLNLTEVAFLLGYSEQSSFTSAFKLWHGCTPGRYRESLN